MKSILLCNEDPIIRMSLKKNLRTLGFEEITECADGDAAVRLTMDRFPDIVILDAAMPKKDGITTAAEIRQKLKIPVILVAAAADADVMARAKRIGVASFLMRPLRDQDLWPAIELAFAHNDEVEQLKEQVEDLKETLENRKVIEKAKGVVMRNQSLSEPEAFRKMQKLAMDKRKSLRQIAEAILLTE